MKILFVFNGKDTTFFRNMQLTPHFTLEELTRSATAEQRGIDNTPNEEVVENLRTLCRNVLEPARTAFGAPIYVSSGYRCTELNRAVGGKPTSQHLRGEAADLQVKGVANLRKLYKILDRLPHDQLLYETNAKGTKWLHISFVKFGNRNQSIDNYKA